MCLNVDFTGEMSSFKCLLCADYTPLEVPKKEVGIILIGIQAHETGR